MPSRMTRPFDGRPASADLELFLFTPDTLLRTIGTTIRKEFSERGYESQYKILEKARAGKAINREHLLKKMKEFHDQFQLPDNPDPILQEFLAILDNPDATISSELARLSSWGSYFLSARELAPHHRHILDIEKRSYDAHQLFCLGDSQAATDALLSDSVMKGFLWPEAITALRNMPQLTQYSQHPAQVAVALEVHLSILSALDVQLSWSESWFEPLLPTARQNVTARLFQWMKGEYRTIEDWLDRPEFIELVGSGELDTPTVKRWSAGRVHPSHAKVTAIANALFERADGVPLLARDFAARLLNLLIYHADNIRASSRENPGPQWLPWPTLPFGYPDVTTWLHARYSFWYRHHQALTIKNR